MNDPLPNQRHGLRGNSKVIKAYFRGRGGSRNKYVFTIH